MKKFTLPTIFVFFVSLFFISDVSAQVFGWGSNGFGNLGNGNTIDQPTPISIGQSNVTAINTNFFHTLALKADGTVLAWGDNQYGNLGDNTTTQRSSPVAVLNLTNVIAVSAGEPHSVALKSDGTVWVWGRNIEGELGQGTSDSTNHPLPVQVPGLTNIVAISAHFLQTLALKSDGTVWAWGNNGNGQIGNNTSGNNVLSPTKVLNLTNVIQIAAGYQHSAALKSDGTVWVWGYNVYGQIGNNTTNSSGCGCQPLPTQSTISGVSQITAGFYNTAALKPNGDVFVWGYNNYGATGNNTTGGNALLPVQSTIGNVVDLKMRGYHLLARQRDGTVKAWGYNYEGQVGDGTTTTTGCSCKPLPTTSLVGSGNTLIAAGDYHSISVKPSISTGTGSSILLTGENVRLNFGSVTGAGTTTYTPIDPQTNPAVTGLTVPSGYVIQNNEPAYNITTTAATSGNIDVCLNVTGEVSPAAFANLKILHGEGGAFVDRTFSSTYIRRQICARVTSLSPFVIAQGLAPTAANVSVSGKVLSGKTGIARATVSITDSYGMVRTVKTNSFGVFSFDNLEAGQTYVFNVTARGYAFAPQVETVSDNLADFDFSAL